MRMRYRTVVYQITEADTHRQVYQQLVNEFSRQVQVSRSASRRAPTWRPPIDVHETATDFIIKIELAGMAEEDIDVTIYADAVVVSGTRLDDEMDDVTASFHEAQIRYGAFQAVLLLSTPIDRDGTEARYHNGFLRLRIAKKPHEHIPVQSGQKHESVSQTNDSPPAMTVSETNEEVK